MSEASKLRAVIVEDEEASRETLKNYLGKYCPNVQLLGMAESVQTGLEAIKQHKPDIVFLDIEMPYGNAFDLLDQLDNIDFEIVFVTAYSNYAIKALNMSAAYYILKPVDIDELISAVDKITQSRLENKDAFHTKVLMENLKSAHNQLHKIVLPQLDGFEVVQVKDILRCEAADNFTKFYMLDGTNYLICRTLKFFDELLSEFDFVRVHKSHLINLKQVVKYKKGKGGQVGMTDGSFIDVSVTKKQNLLDRFR